eukprot:758878-Hanusia_phi.AAC.1
MGWGTLFARTRPGVPESPNRGEGCRCCAGLTTGVLVRAMGGRRREGGSQSLEVHSEAHCEFRAVLRSPLGQLQPLSALRDPEYHPPLSISKRPGSQNAMGGE